MTERPVVLPPEGQAVMHKFHLGQTVEYHAPRGIDVPRGAYLVTAKLPERDGQLEYRIRSANEPFDRMVREFELQAMAGNESSPARPKAGPREPGKKT